MNTETGREDLRAWQESKPGNFFGADENIQRVLRFHLGDARYQSARQSLETLGEQAASVINQAAIEEDRIGNHPVIERHDAIGDRVETIRYHPNHDLTGRLVWESGIMASQAEPGNVTHQMALYYLLCQNGEAGHMCSIACTSGLIRAIQQHGGGALKERFLPPLLNPDYGEMQHGAQFLTEVQGGSDVGANSVSASQDGDGAWRVSGEKWFCSNIGADQLLLTARPEGAPDGTKGLGLFLVPRRLDGETPNAFYLNRLKDKLGTRSLPTAEVEFDGALAYPVGPLDEGFKIAVEIVLNTSRMCNAVGSIGLMRRTLVEATSFACNRQAFGDAIINYPLIQEALALIKSETYAATASTFALADLLDRIETGVASEAEHSFFRLLVNVNKYWTSIRATEVVHKGIEVLGGNGAIETFSVLPRLYRDAIVYESWEGTHNVLCLQVLRDCAKYEIHHHAADELTRRLAKVRAQELTPTRDEIQRRLNSAIARLDALLGGDQMRAQAHIRRVIDELAVVTQAAFLLSEADWEMSAAMASDKTQAIEFLLNRHLRDGYDPLEDPDYLLRVTALAGSI